MKTEHKNNQHSQGTKADSKRNDNQHPGTKNTDRNQRQDYSSKSSPGMDDEQTYSLDDKTAKKPLTGNDKKKSEQPARYPASGDTATMADDDDDSLSGEGKKEYDDTDHQHEYKVPQSPDKNSDNKNHHATKSGNHKH